MDLLLDINPFKVDVHKEFQVANLVSSSQPCAQLTSSIPWKGQMFGISLKTCVEVYLIRGRYVNIKIALLALPNCLKVSSVKSFEAEQ